MVGFALRMKTASELESRIHDAVNGLGSWSSRTIYIPYHLHQEFIRTRTGNSKIDEMIKLIRHWPDLEIRMSRNGDFQSRPDYYIDAKSDRWNTGNLSIETDSMLACRQIMKTWGVKTLFVGPQLQWFDSLMVFNHGMEGKAPKDGRGSGTPYYLIPKDKCNPDFLGMLSRKAQTNGN